MLQKRDIKFQNAWIIFPGQSQNLDQTLREN